MPYGHSSELQWLIVRRNSKFLQIRNGIRLSNDPLNNSGLWTRRQAGFLNEKVVITKTKGNSIVASVSDGNSTKPKLRFRKITFPGDVKPSEVRRTLAATRKDLGNISFRRSQRLIKSIRRVDKVRAARKKHTESVLARRPSNMPAKRQTIRPKRN